MTDRELVLLIFGLRRLRQQHQNDLRRHDRRGTEGGPMHRKLVAEAVDVRRLHAKLMNEATRRGVVVPAHNSEPLR